MGGFTNKIYYAAKPILPRGMQLLLRRIRAALLRGMNTRTWPIDEKAGRPPEGFSGWPGGKKFALVLTHDVETAAGQEKCRELARLEEELGFRSSFNFVPRRYEVSPELRFWLADMGFEIGVHGLYHDGKYYDSLEVFRARSVQINGYLTDWRAVGFRSPSMLRRLDWHHNLDIEYDTSTFDTDPFEPQPEGAGTIFPFFVPGSGPNGGYVELPYTLPQDSTLFVILHEKNIDIWRKKLDWIAERGGMALLDTHPDYMSFGAAAPGREEYPVSFYGEFLEYVKSRYGGLFWHALPREAARWWRANIVQNQDRADERNKMTAGERIWIDLDNSPHVPFFMPIIRELQNRGYDVTLTARDCFQVCGLMEMNDIPYKRIGRHFGKNRLMKVAGMALRAVELLPSAMKERPALALSHGSRSQLLAAALLKIPSVVIDDYEYSEFCRWLVHPSWFIVPEVISGDNLKKYTGDRIVKYPGIKEDVYVPDFRPRAAFMSELGIDGEGLLVTVRPPATEAHYHTAESETLFEAAMNFLGSRPEVTMVVLPRNGRQADAIRRAWPEWLRSGKIVIPERVVDGLNLIWHSDFVVSGGGTMNRESAALGVPAYSIFRGKIGAVDRFLAENGRLVLIETPEDLRSKIRLDRRPKEGSPGSGGNAALGRIIRAIEEIIQNCNIPRGRSTGQ